MTKTKVLGYTFNKMRGYPLAMVAFVLNLMCFGIEILIAPYVSKLIIDRLSEGASAFSLIYGPIALYIVAYVFIFIINRIYSYFVEIKMIPMLRREIAKEALTNVIHETYAYHKANSAGTLGTKINNLTDSIPDMITALHEIIKVFFALFSVVFILFRSHISFAILMLLWSLAFALFIPYQSVLINVLSRNFYSIYAKNIGKIVDTLNNIVSVKLFLGIKKEKQFTDQAFTESTAAEQRLQWSYLLISIYIVFSWLVMQLFNIYFLCRGIDEKWLTIGDFTLVISTHSSVVSHLITIASYLCQFYSLYGQIEQALNTVMTNNKKDEIKEELVIDKGDIEFENVSFAYNGNLFFENLSMKIKSKEKVALVGYSGSGKSTFAKLIVGLNEANSGKIMIDGQNVKNLKQKSLYREITFIPQNTTLFSRTIFENVAYVKDSVTLDEVIECCKKADAHNFILKLTNQYNTNVGDSGSNLSGGQIQRISIARAILKDSPILIMDEAMSEIDVLTESHIQNNLNQNKTMIVVTHRVDGLHRFDRILVFDNGKIVQDGPHFDLVKDPNGIYYGLVHRELEEIE